MKTQNIIAAIILTLSTVTVSFANAPGRMLTFKDSLGRDLTMPVKEEVAVDVLPFEIAAEFQKARWENANRIIDLSTMTRPEGDAMDVDIDLRAVYESLKTEIE